MSFKSINLIRIRLKVDRNAVTTKMKKMKTRTMKTMRTAKKAPGGADVLVFSLARLPFCSPELIVNNPFSFSRWMSVAEEEVQAKQILGSRGRG